MSTYLAESATLDILDNYNGRDSFMPPEKERDQIPAGIDQKPNRPLSLVPERQPSRLTCNSSTNLMPVGDSPSPSSSPGPNHHVKSPSRSSPFYWNLPSQLSTLEQKRTRTVQDSTVPTKFWHGWKVILFGSCMYIPLLVDYHCGNCAHHPAHMYSR